MKILLNENQMTAYATIGSIAGALDYTGDIPVDFEEKFRPNYYMLEKGVIVENPNYEEFEPEEVANGPSEIDVLKKEIEEMKKILEEIKNVN